MKAANEPKYLQVEKEDQERLESRSKPSKKAKTPAVELPVEPNSADKPAGDDIPLDPPEASQDATADLEIVPDDLPAEQPSAREGIDMEGTSFLMPDSAPEPAD